MYWVLANVTNHTGERDVDMSEPDVHGQPAVEALGGEGAVGGARHASPRHVPRRAMLTNCNQHNKNSGKN